MENKMEKIISLCKRRGFIYQGSEIYGGLAGTWDWGPMGVAIKNNIMNSWRKNFIENRNDMFEVDAAILMSAKVWEASGHVSGFADPLVECKKCKKRFRSDHLENKNKCPECGGELGDERQFNMMFKTNIGAMEDDASIVYLRPETAGGIFVNYKNVLDSFHPKMPFGVGQIGKAFRNEIAPRDFIFRVRELEQMEIEYFCNPKDWEKLFENWRVEIKKWFASVGLPEKNVHELEIADGDRAHYSKRTIDFEFDYPFGQKELCGLAYRTDFDLSRHAENSKADLTYFDEETKERYTPHVIEPSFGLGRTALALISSAYDEEEVNNETRIILHFSPKMAPYKAAIFPLVKNKPEIVEKAKSVFEKLKENFVCAFDDNGNVGKRYRRHDEIGTPACVTIDYQTLEDETVTVRDRDTMAQERVAISELANYIKNKYQL